MTGHGHGTYSNNGLTLTVEIRTVNSRYAKVNVRCGEAYQSIEPQIEELVKKKIRRGTVQVNVRIERRLSASGIRVNDSILQQYADAIKRIDPTSAIAFESLLGLPGVIEESTDRREMVESDWPHIESTIENALVKLGEMRAAEGASMELDLVKNCNAIEASVVDIERKAPAVIESYQNRLTEKLNALLQETSTEMSKSDIIREVGIFADRCDISEETVRLRTHIEQFRKVMGQKESQGRKLDFLTQEMFRETNTIGSKANDAEIAQFVVDMKTNIERIREMDQNIE